MVVVTIFGIIGMWIMLGVTLPEAIAFAAPYLPGDIIKAVIAGGITQALYAARPGLAAIRA
jgi:biotin transport system substrate-specific component